MYSQHVPFMNDSFVYMYIYIYIPYIINWLCYVQFKPWQALVEEAASVELMSRAAKHAVPAMKGGRCLEASADEPK